MSDCNKPKTNGCGCPPPVIIPGEINGHAGPAGSQGATGDSGTNVSPDSSSGGSRTIEDINDL